MILPESGDTTKWLSTLGSATVDISAHCNVLRGGQVFDDVPVEKIAYTLDRTAAIRRTCTVSLTPQISGNKVDLAWQDTFAPWGNEIRPWYLITFPDGSTDEVSLGTYTIVSSTWAFSGTDLVITIKGEDRSTLLSLAEALIPVTLPGVTIDQAISEFVSSQNFGVPIQINVQPTSVMVPATGAIVKPGKTIWSQVLELAAAANYEVFFDVYGNLVGQTIPTPNANNAVVTVTTLAASGALTATANATRKKIYSEFGVVGAGTQYSISTKTGKMIHKKVAIYGQAADTNPNSPTYTYGAFGSIGKLTRSGIVSTQAAADEMAAGLLAQQVGAATAMDLSILPFPLLDCWDVVNATVPEIGVQGSYVVDGYTLDVHFSGTQKLVIRQVF